MHRFGGAKPRNVVRIDPRADDNGVANSRRPVRIEYGVARAKGVDHAFERALPLRRLGGGGVKPSGQCEEVVRETRSRLSQVRRVRGAAKPSASATAAVWYLRDTSRQKCISFKGERSSPPILWGATTESPPSVLTQVMVAGGIG